MAQHSPFQPNAQSPVAIQNDRPLSRISVASSRPSSRMYPANYVNFQMPGQSFSQVVEGQEMLGHPTQTVPNQPGMAPGQTSMPNKVQFLAQTQAQVQYQAQSHSQATGPHFQTTQYQAPGQLYVNTQMTGQNIAPPRYVPEETTQTQPNSILMVQQTDSTQRAVNFAPAAPQVVYVGVDGNLLPNQDIYRQRYESDPAASIINTDRPRTTSTLQALPLQNLPQQNTNANRKPKSSNHKNKKLQQAEEEALEHFLDKLHKKPKPICSRAWTTNCVKWLIPSVIAFPIVLGLNLWILSRSETINQELNAENYSTSYVFLSILIVIGLMGFCMKNSYNQKPHLLDMRYQIVSLMGKLAYVVFVTATMCACVVNPLVMFFCSMKQMCG